jgi:hypothetical protein
MPVPASPARSRPLAEPAVGQHHLQPPGHLARARPGALQAGGDASGVHRLGEPDGLARDPASSRAGNGSGDGPSARRTARRPRAGPGHPPRRAGPGPGWAAPRTSSRSASRTPCRPAPTGPRRGAGRATVRGRRRRAGGPRPRTGRSPGRTACWRPARWPSSCRHRSGHRAARAGCRLRNTRLPSRAQAASREQRRRTRQPPATSEAAAGSAASRPASGPFFAAGPPLHRPAASGLPEPSPPAAV